MDPLDVMSNLDKIIPYYQAIFSADEQCVIGYELLGRIEIDGEVKSLGSFFEDENVPDEYRLEVDEVILAKALEYIMGSTDQEMLIFINRDANLLMIDQGESFLNYLLKMEERGLCLHRIVIEIAEHRFKGDIGDLYHLLAYYRTYGIKIAIDNIGKESSNLDRIGLLAPDILKIDLQPLRLTSPMQSYYDVLYSISLLARKIGATLLYEDIEVGFQLQHAWKNGGRYFQGYYLHEPNESLMQKDLLKEKLQLEFQQFIQIEKRKLETLYEQQKLFQQRMDRIYAKLNKQPIHYDHFLQELAAHLDDCCFRIYICDGDGVQLSANVFKKEEWELQREYYLRNWSWRPYFLENIMKMRLNKKGFLSDLYSDIETGEMIRTFSYPLHDGHYLFLDLSYAYLYEQDGLL